MDLFPFALSVALISYVLFCVKRGHIKSKDGSILYEKGKDPTGFWLMMGMYIFGAFLFLALSIVGFEHVIKFFHQLIEKLYA